MKKGTVFVGLGAGLLLVTVVSMAMGDKNPQTKEGKLKNAKANVPKTDA